MRSAQKTINDPNAEKRNVSGFRAIEVGSGIDLHLSQGTEAVAVSAADTKYRDRIKTEVVKGVLKIEYEYDKGTKNNWTDSKMKLKAYVSIKDIEGLHARGGSDVFVDGTVKSSKIEINISGGSDFDGKVEAGTMTAHVSGGSDMKISGSAKSLRVNASGGSDFEGFGLIVDECNADASGGSDISITAMKEINVETSGGSDIHYKGAAVIRNVKTSGGGSIKKESK